MELAASSTVSEDQRLEQLVARARPRRIVVVTGAGISAESGIPTYRGEEGYWTETSANYQPEQTGYLSYFHEHPREVWRFALRHRETCGRASPNAAHRALAELEREFADGFLLVTQNVDGLHLRAGNSRARTIEAHGSVNFMRAVNGDPTLLPVPESVTDPGRDEPLDDASFAALVTPDGRPTRPHAMFFDEAYDEELYRSETAMAAADACDLLLVIGTSGATAIPWHLAVRAREADAAIVVIDPEETPFAIHARNRERASKGLWLRGGSTRWTPRVVELLLAQLHLPSDAAPIEPSEPPPRRAPSIRREVTLEPACEPSSPDIASSRALAELLARRQPRRVVVSTGAGISAESGIRTYRGANGYWTVPARSGQPISRAEFERAPRETWAFMLRKRAVCNAAAPNAAHLALAQLERALGDDLRVITQNVDGLHRRAGNSAARTYELHGSCNLMRAVDPADGSVADPLPVELPACAALEHDAALGDEIWDALVMPDGSRTRPHVLLWDEAYNEVQYRSESALAAGRGCDLLVTIGTSGSAALPYAIAAEAVLGADATLIDINPEDNPYAEHARTRAEDGKGLSLSGTATRWVPELVAQLIALREQLYPNPRS